MAKLKRGWYLPKGKEVPIEAGKPLSEQEQEIVYAASFGLYEKGDYSKAADLFTQLLVINPFQEKYWRGLAAARQMEKSYDQALHAWAVVAIFAEKDALAQFHAAECLISLNETEDAKKALRASEELLDCKENPLRNKIELLRNML